jgi:hypothetical protein
MLSRTLAWGVTVKQLLFASAGILLFLQLLYVMLRPKADADLLALHELVDRSGKCKYETHAAAISPASVTAPVMAAVPCHELGISTARHLDARWERVSSELPAISQKGLLLIPSGAKGSKLVDATLCHFLSSGFFDVIILAYDDHDWSKHAWYKNPQVSVKRSSGNKYNLAKNVVPQLPKEYSHVFLWDDDVVPVLNEFSASSFLRLLQALPHVLVASPLVDGECHKVCWALNDPPIAHAISTTVEMMAPIYHRDIWECMLSLVHDYYPDSWGIDGIALTCGCKAELKKGAQLYFPNFKATHVSTKSLGGSFSSSRAMDHWAQLEKEVASSVGPTFTTCAQEQVSEDASTPKTRICISINGS